MRQWEEKKISVPPPKILTVVFQIQMTLNIENTFNLLFSYVNNNLLQLYAFVNGRGKRKPKEWHNIISLMVGSGG